MIVEKIRIILLQYKYVNVTTYYNNKKKQGFLRRAVLT